MKFWTALSLATLALAAPAELEKRQRAGKAGAGKTGGGGGGGGGTCLVFARGSAEPAPLGLLIGPGLLTSLKMKIPGIQSFPVYYGADLLTNVSPARTDAGSIAKGVQAFKQASAKCSVIVAGGYSQGAAVMHNVVGKSLDASIKAKIAGVALFGDTRNQQDHGHIPNFPKEKSKVWCNIGDGVCTGQLLVNVGHLSYGPGTTSEAATWLAGRIQAHRKSG